MLQTELLSFHLPNGVSRLLGYCHFPRGGNMDQRLNYLRLIFSKARQMIVFALHL